MYGKAFNTHTNTFTRIIKVDSKNQMCTKRKRFVARRICQRKDSHRFRLIFKAHRSPLETLMGKKAFDRLEHPQHLHGTNFSGGMRMRLRGTTVAAFGCLYQIMERMLFEKAVIMKGPN